MSRYAPKTLRRMPPTTREIARLANELASVQTRLANRVERLASMEMMAGASQRVFCNNGAHANVVNAALHYVQALDDPEMHGSVRRDALSWLRSAVAPLDPDRLFAEAGARARGRREQLDAPREERMDKAVLLRRERRCISIRVRHRRTTTHTKEN